MMTSANKSAQHQAPASAASSALQPYIVLSYGVADSLSRIRVLSLEDVDHLFDAAPWSKRRAPAGAPAVNSPSSKHDIEQQILLLDVAGLVKAVRNYKDGAAVMYWNVQHCGEHLVG
jgi:hypothetical protein